MSRFGAIRLTVPVDVVWPGERRAVHVAGPPAHRDARVDVLRDRVLHEARGRDHRQPGVRLRLGDDALHTAEVVDVAVGVDHRGHRTVPAVLAIQPPGRGRGLQREQRVDHDHARLPFDEGDVRQVVAAHLVDALDHLEEPLDGGQRALPPQARVDGVGRVAAEEGVGAVVPHHLAAVIGDGALPCGDQAAGRVVEVRTVVEGEQPLVECSVGTHRRVSFVGAA